MKKRIISIMLTICMVVAIVSVTSVSATAAESCNCLIKCKAANMNTDCPVCSKSGATVDDCEGRISWTESGGSPITTCAQLQNLMSVTGWTDIYYFPLEANITFATWKDIIEVPQGADVVIDLNGKTLSGNDVGMIFEVSGNLTIIDSKGTGKITHADGGAINILDGGSVLMQGGSIEDNYGGVRVNSGGKFEITGGTMKNNEALYLSFGTSCNITVNSSGTVIIGDDAQILCCDQSGCSCSDNQIAVNTGGTLYVDGGKIKGTVYNKGAIVSTLSGVGTVINGSVDNLGTISAGTYYGEVTNESKGTISGGRFISKVTNNGSISSGKFDSEVDNKGTISGGMYFEDSNVLNAGTISGGLFIGTVAGNGTIEDSAKVPVYFVTDTDKIINTVKVLRGQGIPSADLISPNPKTYGYNNFSGWRIDSADFTGGGQFINDANYVTAKFSNPITYNITYNLDSGTATNPTSYTVESEAITLKKPTKTDYIFIGWSGTDLTGEDNMSVTIPKGSIGNKTYTAHYIEESILGSVSTEAELKNALDLGVTSIKLVGDFKLSSLLNLTDKQITIDLNGHTLTGDIKLSDNSAAPDSVLTLIDSDPNGGGVLNGKITLTRGSGSKSHLYANGGTVTGQVSLPSYAGGIFCTSDTPTVFKDYVGNYGEIHGGIFYGGINTSCIKEKTVTFMNGDSRYALEVVAAGNNVVEPISPSVKAGYQAFDGWYDGDTKYTFGSTLDANITLTAKFSDPITYNIACDLDGGTATNLTSYNVESDDITLNNPTKVGYTFTGWNGTGLTGEDNMTVTIPKGSTGNKTYTAHYIEKSGYTVAFDVGGENDTSSKTDVKWTDKVLDGVGTPTKAGYTFVGWKCGETEITANTTYSEIADSDTVLEIKLTAQWEDATVKYGDLNGDGKVNLLDLIAMRKYLANWSIEVNTAAADCNADGKINLFDLILMRKYLANWSVVLGPQA